jgi:acetyl-CoA C-acetyltransferase
MPLNEAVIVSACRTPVGSFRGALGSIPAPRLGAIVIEEAVRRAGIGGGDVQEVIMGNVLQAGVGQAPARQASIFAGLPPSVECMTVNKVCGSGLKSVMLAAQAVILGDADVVVAGGMESMSNAPYMLDKARDGYRIGNGELQDAIMRDGLVDVYDNIPMGNAAEACAREMNITRAMQDEYAVLSYTRAQEAQKAGRFRAEIVGVEIRGRKGDISLVVDDEDVFKTDFAKIPGLKPAFIKDGTVTAANASNINDGAAALVVMSAAKARQLGCKPLARIVAQASFAKEPLRFTTAPAEAIPKVLKKAGLSLAQIDLFEVNEAFAVVALAVRKIVGLELEKMNVNGGAVAIGHPLGASGARILVTLLYALEQRTAKRGLAALCIGGGEGTALIVERL